MAGSDICSEILLLPVLYRFSAVFFLVLGVFIFCLHASLHYLNVFLYLCVFFLVCIVNVLFAWFNFFFTCSVSLMYHKRHVVHQLSFNITGIICL